MHLGSLLSLFLLGMTATKASKINKANCFDEFDEDIDYPGNDLNLDAATNFHKTSSAGACQDLCSSTDGCQYFTWSTNHHCYLKHLKSTETYEKGAISGSKYCKGYVWKERTNTFRDPECSKIGNISGLTIPDCKNKCDKTPACNAINVRTDPRNLKHWILKIANLGQNKGEKDCILLACPFVELQNPKWKLRGFKSYFKKFDGCSEDEISEICSCPRNMDPVCAGGIFYDNLCLYQCAKKEAECTGQKAFPEVVNNETECQEQKQEPKVGGCSEKEIHDACFCTRLWDPVCSGGVTYGNPCMYQCAKKKALCGGERAFPQITKYGECQLE